jgi:hypothetical protein
MKSLVSGTLAAIVFGMALAVSGCGGGGSGEAKALMKDYADILESIQSVDDLKANKEKLVDLARKIDELDPSEEEGVKMMADGEVRDLMTRIGKESMRIATDTELGEEFSKLMSESQGEGTE